jgi:protease IV
MNVPIQQGVVTEPPSTGNRGPLVVVQQAVPRRRWRTWLLFLVLLISVAFNFILFNAYHSYLGTGEGVLERFHSGELTATDKIALIYVEGTISPPFTGHILKAVEQAGRDEHVKGVVLVVDSPGGLVADSHEIYHELRKLNQDHHKPIYVSMRRLAASGGYYVSMGAGPDGLLFAEPTTWAGSIGVIIPHYDVSGLADKLGVKEDSPKTGKFKDTLTIFRPVSEAEKELWKPILDDSLDRFVKVIADSRKSLDVKQIRELATGQIFTSNQAMEKKLIDKIGYLEDAIDALKSKLQLKNVRVVRYESSQTLLETILSSRSAVSPPQSQLGALLESTVPRAYYLFSTAPGLATGAR